MPCDASRRIDRGGNYSADDENVVGVSGKKWRLRFFASLRMTGEEQRAKQKSKIPKSREDAGATRDEANASGHLDPKPIGRDLSYDLDWQRIKCAAMI
jgi:hypothetical protein